MTHSFSSPHKTPAPSRDDILSPSWQWLSWWQWNWRKILIWNCHFVPRIKNTVYLKSSSNKHPSQLLPENFLCFLFSFSDAAAALWGHCHLCQCLPFLPRYLVSNSLKWSLFYVNYSYTTFEDKKIEKNCHPNILRMLWLGLFSTINSRTIITVINKVYIVYTGLFL